MQKLEARSDTAEFRNGAAPRSIAERPEILQKAVSHLLLYTEVDVRRNVATLPPPTAQAVLGLFLFARENRMSNASLSPGVGIDKSVIGRLFNGTYVIQNYKEITGKICGFLKKQSFPLPTVPQPEPSVVKIETPELSGRGKWFNIPGDVVMQSVFEMREAQRDAIVWFQRYCYDRDVAPEKVAKIIGLPWVDIVHMFRGLRSDVEVFVAAIEKFKAGLAQTKKGSVIIKRIAFIETNLTRRIFSLCQTALDFRRFVFMYNDSQTGKSTALKQFAALHPGSVVYVEMPQSGNLCEFKMALAEALGMGTKMSSQSLTLRLRKALRPFADQPSDMLLLIDEVHQVFVNNNVKRKAARVQTLEYIRLLFNQCECGVVLCGTDVLPDQMKNGVHAKLLKQLFRRSLCSIPLKNSPTKDDLRKIAAAYGLPEASGEALEKQTTAISENGLGMWFMLLQSASKIAAKEKMTWEHVIDAQAAIDHLADASTEEKEAA